MKDIISLNWENPVSQKRIELVFENRFKDYGAYEIRKSYEKNVALALLISISFLVLCVSIPFIANLLPSATKISKAKDDIVIIFSDNFLKPPVVPLPAPTVLHPPSIKTVSFNNIQVIDKPFDDIQPPSQEILNTQNFGAVATVGDSSNTETTPIVSVPIPENNNPFSSVEEMPVFPGGDEAFSKYLNHVPYPADAMYRNITGRVFVYFVIEKDGSIGDVKLQHGVGKGGLDEAAIHWIKDMPAWTPGKQNGKPVRVRYTVPFYFTLK